MQDQPNCNQAASGGATADPLAMMMAQADAKAGEIAQQLAAGNVSLTVTPGGGTVGADAALAIDADYAALIPGIIHALRMRGVEAIAAYTASAPVIEATGDDDVRDRLDGARGCWVFHALEGVEDGGAR